MEDGKRGFGIEQIEVIDSVTALQYMFLLHGMDGNIWCKMYKKELLEGLRLDTRRNCDFVTIANVMAGRNNGSVVISGVGMYGGSVEVRFSIGSKRIYSGKG